MSTGRLEVSAKFSIRKAQARPVLAEIIAFPLSSPFPVPAPALPVCRKKPLSVGCARPRRAPYVSKSLQVPVELEAGPVEVSAAVPPFEAPSLVRKAGAPAASALGGPLGQAHVVALPEV